MTTPVLKNRILALTDGRFTEARYGARSLTDFVTKFNDLITLDGSRIPPIVELRDHERIHVTPSELERGSRPPRIRSDLWRATLDYASGQTYVWDAKENQARPQEPGDGLTVIPTITSEQLQRWRIDFSETESSSETTQSDELERLSHWRDNQLPTAELPPRLMPLWNRYLRERVHELLQTWFEKIGMAPPSDLVITQPTTVVRPSETEDLRQLVMRVVEQMTERELADLVLPSRAVLRATGRRR